MLLQIPSSLLEILAASRRYLYRAERASARRGDPARLFFCLSRAEMQIQCLSPPSRSRRAHTRQCRRCGLSKSRVSGERGSTAFRFRSFLSLCRRKVLCRRARASKVAAPRRRESRCVPMYHSSSATLRILRRMLPKYRLSWRASRLLSYIREIQCPFRCSFLHYLLDLYYTLPACNSQVRHKTAAHGFLLSKPKKTDF